MVQRFDFGSRQPLRQADRVAFLHKHTLQE